MVVVMRRVIMAMVMMVVVTVAATVVLVAVAVMNPHVPAWPPWVVVENQALDRDRHGHGRQAVPKQMGL